MLPSCATSSGIFRPPPLPADLKLCFDTIVPAPDIGAMSKADVTGLIVDLKTSEFEKVLCGKRIIAFYGG